MPLLLLLLLPPLPPLLLPRLMVFPGSMSFIVIGVPEEATEAVEEEAAEVLADVLDFRVRTVLPFFLPYLISYLESRQYYFFLTNYEPDYAKLCVLEIRITYVVVCKPLVRQMCHLAVSLQDESRIGAAIFIELVIGIENNEGNLALAEDAEFHGLFDQSVPSLVERHVTIAVVLDGLDFNLSSSHVRCYRRRHYIHEYWEDQKSKG